ncbi:MAG TPA: ATP-binding protein [Polyangia bacterium]|nr:ATP-binding protein [Polyangia bacterium]
MLLGVLTSCLSLVALLRALWMLKATQRVERAREAVLEELHHVATLAPSAGALAGPPASTLVGVRGGWLPGPDEVAAAPGLPPAWRAPLERAARESARRHTTVVTETDVEPSKLVVAAAPASAGGLAWVAYLVRPSSYLWPWRWISYGLGAATALLFATAVLGVYSLRRSTASLHATLFALGRDLTTPVPAPAIAELTGIADGIRRMASELLASREVTERLAGELRQQERMAALGRVATGVAHEVRNPLASIKLRLDLTAATQALPEPARQAVAAASQEIARLDRLVGDLLVVAGKKMGPRRAVELGALVRARADALGPWAQAQSVAVKAEGAGVADVDPESLARAIDNVLRNAVEASPEGAAVEARVVETSQAVEVEVSDCGRGVEPERVPELFEPFFTTKAEGTGLGLAISRAIARAHGGDLTYARMSGVTRFSLRLPRGARPRQAAA